MRLKILGSGGWAGIPVAFCHCRVCRRAKRDQDGKDYRTRPQFLVESSEGKLLIEISPDIRLQSIRFNLPNISHFLLSHGHFDHMGGLEQLNSWIRYSLQEKPTIYCSKKTKQYLEYYDNDILKTIRTINPYETFEIHGMRITPIPLYHEHSFDNVTPENKLANEFGFIFHYRNHTLAYLGDYYKVPEQAKELLHGTDTVLMDATYFMQEKYPRHKEQLGLWRDPDHLHGERILQLAAELAPRRVVLTNITHLLGLTHNEMTALLPKGFSLAYDGMELELH